MKSAVFLTRGFAVAATLLVGLAFATAPPAAAQSVTVVIGGNPLYLNPGPIERTGRVFVPLRAIFQQLGASVVYQAGTINATRGNTTVSLQIGSTQATVNGQAQYLDVAPFIIGATTYVPLRFVAQSLGANVNYNDSTRVVAINVSGGGNAPRPVPPRPNPPPPPVVVPANPITLRAQQPAAGTNISNRFAVISAGFSREVDAGSVRVRLDGNDITSRCGVSTTAFSYKPPAPLDFGSHTVRVTGRGPAGGSPFDQSWSFVVIRSGPPMVQLTIKQPGPNAVVGTTFAVRGTAYPNAQVRITAGAGQAATGQFDASTTAGPQGNFELRVTLAPMPGQQAVRVKITATDPVTSQRSEQTLQLRINQ